MYPLALSVNHDSASYDARLHAARKLLQGYYKPAEFMRDIRAICALKARDERAAFRVKIKPADITTQAREVADYALNHAREMIRDGYTGGRCHATIRRWWDKTNGNSYFSVTVRIPQLSGFTLFYVPYQYGYGSQPEWETVSELVSLGLFKRAEHHSPGSYPVDFEDQGYMQKGKL
jgi:hypothetical protein